MRIIYEIIIVIIIKHFPVALLHFQFWFMQNMLVFYAKIITEIIYANYRCMIVKLTGVQPWVWIIIYDQDQIIGDGQ